MLWNGFECIESEFEGHETKVILPREAKKNLPLIIKTEYFGAFPDTEISLLEKGYHLAYIKNDNRWGTDADIDRKASFIIHVCEKYGLKKSCVPVGMSCGGIFAVKLAAKYPELVSCIYVDAPVVNYMSCPCGFGDGIRFDEDHGEIIKALSLDGIPQLLAYRDMPLDSLHKLIENRIPAVIVAGDSDRTVPYHENGAFIEKAYSSSGVDFEVYIKKGCDHHPHGLEDTSPVVGFIVKHS